MSLRARKPTGQVAWPFVLVEGEEKAGKSALAYRLARSPRIDRTFVFDLGEGTADEYAELGPYEIVDHDGTFTSLLEQMREAAAVPARGDKANAIILDDGTVLWDLLKDWASARARQSKRAQDQIRRDPDAEIDVPRNLWNDASERWGQVVNLLRTFPGIGVMLARGKEVSGTGPDGQPTKTKEWHVEVQKTTAGAASAWVRCMRPHTASLVGVRNLHLEVPPGGLALPNGSLADNPLEHLIFEVLGAGGFVESQRIAPSLADMDPGRPFDDDEGPTRTPEDIDAQARADGWPSAAAAKAAWDAVRVRAEAGDPVARRRTRLWAKDNIVGGSRGAHDRLVAAADWFAEHRAAQVARGEEPFEAAGEEDLLDAEAVAGYTAELAGAQGAQGPPAPPTPPEEADRAAGEQQAAPLPFTEAVVARIVRRLDPEMTAPAPPGLVRQVNISLGRYGIKGDARFGVLAPIIGRMVGSTTELTLAEAQAIVEGCAPLAAV